MLKTDLHIHSHYSPDSKADMNDYCLKAIADGVKVIGFTDHADCNELSDSYYHFDIPTYLDDIKRLQDKYSDKLIILSAVEFGEPHRHPKEFERVSNLNLDYIIGSIHYPFDLYINGKLPSIEVTYQQHWDETIAMLQTCNINILGHLDYPRKFSGGQYIEDKAKLNQILKLLVSKNIVPEINASSLNKGLTQPLPTIDIITQYRDLGGRYVTITSDSHVVANLNSHFETIEHQLPLGICNCYFVNKNLKI